MFRQIMRGLAIALLALMLLFVLPAGLALAQAQPMSGDVFYFHLGSEIYRSQNESATVIEEANVNAPTSSSGQALQVAAAIQNATTIFGTIWVGTVGWITEPLGSPTSIVGTASFTVWLSSDDAPPSFSGIGAGVAVLNQQNQTVGNYEYTFNYAHGKVLTATPTPYTFNLDLDRNVLAGQRLVFAVGVGSTTEGWRMNIFFDGTQYQSRVQLPQSITVVPEFEPGATLLTMLIAVVLSFTVKRRILRGKQTRQLL
jgi:hypothetical protein